MKGLAGKVVLVTGGASGTGAGIAQIFAQFGSKVAIGDLHKEPAEALAKELAPIGGNGNGVLGIQLDVTDRASTDDAVSRIEAELGPIDVLVNNAGVSSAAAFLDITDEEFSRLINVNLRGVFVVTQRVLPGMLERGNGRVINISSTAGKEGLPGLAHYCASKFAVIGVTQSLAKEVATSGVTINAVCPGVVRSPLYDDPDTGILRQMGESAWDQFIGGIPLGRPQTPEDIGHACAYLASEYGANVTGEALNVSGAHQVR
jgi:meso-butanediol dehydrogenase/(S,S)-butanediol dehydrogenase/diacetyl reductase